jgi:mRNA interferase MazF
VDVNRGDVVTIALSGAYGKPRPAMIVQSDLFEAHSSVTILPITSDLRTAPLMRLDIEPTLANGLRKPSQVMIDKAQTVPRAKIGKVIGSVEAEVIAAVNRSLTVFLGLA